MLCAPLKRRAIVQCSSRSSVSKGASESTSIEAVLQAFDEDGSPQSGYVVNIQGDLAVSANKQGVLIEPMARFRTRRKRA